MTPNPLLRVLLLACGILSLIASTMMIGMGNDLAE
jgi:hypothetical protein